MHVWNSLEFLCMYLFLPFYTWITQKRTWWASWVKTDGWDPEKRGHFSHATVHDADHSHSVKCWIINTTVCETPASNTAVLHIRSTIFSPEQHLCLLSHSFSFSVSFLFVSPAKTLRYHQRGISTSILLEHCRPIFLLWNTHSIISSISTDYPQPLPRK